MPSSRLCSLLLLWSCAVGCGGGSDDETTGGASATADGGTGNEAGAASDAGASGGGCSCATTEACVKVNVTLEAASPDLPWKLWPEQKLGEGRLLAGVYGAMGTVAKFADNVKLASGFSGQTLQLCVAPSANAQAFCFLDDKADGELKEPSTLLTGSGNYRDTCSKERQLKLTLSAGATQEVSCKLANSCD